MSGWIKIEKSLLSDLRFNRMVRQYCNDSNALRNEGVTALLGALTQLWLYADEHIHDDDTLRASVDDINELVGINDFCNMVPRDWLVIIDPEHIKLPNFLGHNGTSAKFRKQNAARQATFRSKRSNALLTHSNASNDARPDQTRPYKTKTRLEIRGDARGDSAARSTRIPLDFELTQERKAYAEAQGLDAIAVLESFKDYWTAASGAKARKNDWDATWRTWCRNQFSNGSKSRPYKASRSAAEILAEEEREQQSAR